MLGVSGQSVRVPTLTGLSLEGAQALIEAEGLTVGSVTEGYATDEPGHTVIAQSVEPDAEVLAGTPIDLTVSQQQAQVYTPNACFTVAVPLENLQVEVTLETPSGTEVMAYSDILSLGTYPVELSSAEPGKHIVRVYLDGVLMDSTELLFE